MRGRYSVSVVMLLATGSLAHDAPADTTPPTRVTVAVTGHGQIRLIVADGASRPCDASSNRVLFSGHAAAGDEIGLASTTGSVCVDHTYGSMRESEWAGASIWSGSGAGWTGVRTISGSVSTDEP
jgi:hypothetical protein